MCDVAVDAKLYLKIGAAWWHTPGETHHMRFANVCACELTLSRGISVNCKVISHKLQLTTCRIQL